MPTLIPRFKFVDSQRLAVELQQTEKSERRSHTSYWLEAAEDTNF